jgi:hypothetical protein
MIEVILELKLDSLLVNSIGGVGDAVDYVPSKALRFSCERIASSRPLTDNTPSADFEFLNSSSKHDLKTGFDREFDDQLVTSLTIQNAIDTSKVVIAPQSPDNRKKPEGVSSSEMGRMLFTSMPTPGSVDLKLDLFLKHEEFEEVWNMVAQHNVQNVIATLVCFKLEQDGLASKDKTTVVSGVLSSSLRMMPRL